MFVVCLVLFHHNASQEWTKWTWKEYYDDARRLAKAFIKPPSSNGFGSNRDPLRKLGRLGAQQTIWIYLVGRAACDDARLGVEQFGSVTIFGFNEPWMSLTFVICDSFAGSYSSTTYSSRVETASLPRHPNGP